MAQMGSTSDLEKNLAVMRRLAEAAKQQNADLVIFPEVAYFTGPPEVSIKVVPEFSRLKTLFGEWAKELKIALMPGTLREPLPTAPVSHANTLLTYSADGTIIGEYRKIFLFKAALPDHRAYDETKFFSAGNKLSTVKIEDTTFGLSICFDLRFPELFRGLKKRGAQVFLIPSAFLAATGKAHWETLIRARAIENQCYVLAPGLVGVSGDGGMKHGHSLAVDPWGKVLSDMKDREGVEVFELDLTEIARCRERVDVWGSRRDDLFPIG